MWWFGCFLLLASVALALYGLTAYFFWYAIRAQAKTSTRPAKSKAHPGTAALSGGKRARQGIRALRFPGKEDWSLQSWDGLALHALYIPAPWPSRRAMVLVHGYGSTGLDEYARFVRFYHEAGLSPAPAGQPGPWPKRGQIHRLWLAGSPGSPGLDRPADRPPGADCRIACTAFPWRRRGG